MYNRFFEFIDLHGILSAHYYGFRPKQSTYMAIKDLYCKITSDLESKFHTLGIFLDLSKAFDTLNHDIPLHKLNIYGIRSLANTWIKNYLADRNRMLFTIRSLQMTGRKFAVSLKDRSSDCFYFYYILMIIHSLHPLPTYYFC